MASARKWAVSSSGFTGAVGAAHNEGLKRSEKRAAKERKRERAPDVPRGSQLVDKNSAFGKARSAEDHAHVMVRAGINSEAARHFEIAAKHYDEGGHQEESKRARGQADEYKYLTLHAAAKEASKKAEEAGNRGASDSELHGLHEKARAAHEEAGRATAAPRFSGMRSLHADEAKGHHRAMGMLKAGMGSGGGGDDYNRDENGRFAPK